MWGQSNFHRLRRQGRPTRGATQNATHRRHTLSVAHCWSYATLSPNPKPYTPSQLIDSLTGNRTSSQEPPYSHQKSNLAPTDILFCVGVVAEGVPERRAVVASGALAGASRTRSENHALDQASWDTGLLRNISRSSRLRRHRCRDQQSCRNETR